MSALDSLPPDQRAVLQLVVRQGRSYDDLATLLRTSPDAVRTRAQAGLAGLAGDALDAGQRGQIGDYLLNQLGVSQRGEVRRTLTSSPDALAWARRAREELAGLAAGELPELPDESEESAEAPPPAVAPEAGPEPAEPVETVHPEKEPDEEPLDEEDPVETAKRLPDVAAASSAATEDTSPSRLGGIALLAGVGLLIIAIVVALVSSRGGNDSSSPTTSSTPSTQAQTPASSQTSTGQTSTNPAQPQAIAQVNLTTSGTGKPAAIAQLFASNQGAAFFIVARGVPSNTNVGIWLEGAKAKPALLRLVRQGSAEVTSKGELRTQTPVPSAITGYSKMILTRESTTAPKAPGAAFASGPLKVPTGR